MSGNAKARETTSRGPELTRVGREEMGKVEGGVTYRAGALPGNSQQFTIISNILQTMQEPAKNAINNIR